MDIGTISTRYAKALLSFAKDEKKEAEVYKEMACLVKSFLENPELKNFLTNPIVSTEEKKKLLFAASGVNISNTTKSFIEFVVKKKKESYMHFIALSYHDLYQKSKKIISAEFISAEKVSEETIGRIIDIIKKNYKDSNVQLDVKVDSDLIGGFILRVDNNNKLDASVLGELKNMRKELKLENSYNYTKL